MSEIELDDDIATPLRTSGGLYLYSCPSHYLSHLIYWATLEKQIALKHVLIDPTCRPEFIADLNPYGTLPVLADRQLRLYHLESILEYLEERYKQTTLWPDGIHEKAILRQLFWRIKNDWMLKGSLLLDQPDLPASQANALRKELRDSLVEISPIFRQYTWFMSNTFSYSDLILGVFLARLSTMQIILPPKHTISLQNYMKRLFQRPAYLHSLNDFSLL